MLAVPEQRYKCRASSYAVHVVFSPRQHMSHMHAAEEPKPAAGTVTRTSEVRPELFTGCFRCLECGTLVRDVEQQFKFTEPLMCTQTACQNK